jgi:hypothetical protein
MPVHWAQIAGVRGTPDRRRVEGQAARFVNAASKCGQTQEHERDIGGSVLEARAG